MKKLLAIAATTAAVLFTTATNKAMVINTDDSTITIKGRTYYTAIDEVLPKATSREATAYQHLKEKGYSDETIAGILGNFMQESMMDPATVQWSNGEGYGLAQWSYTNCPKMLNYLHDHGVSQLDSYIVYLADNNAFDTESFKAVLGDYNENRMIELELDFLDEEIQQQYYINGFARHGLSLDDFKNLSDVYAATMLFHNVVEASNDSSEALMKRYYNAVEIYEQIKGGSLMSKLN